MKAKWSGKRIAGILSILDSDKKRAVSEMHVYAAKVLLSKKMIQKSEIGAIVVITLTPDYYLPQVSMILHDELNLSEDVICVDIAQGGTGYIVGLTQAFMLLEHIKDKKVLLFTGDIMSCSSQNASRVFTVSVIENNNSYGKIYCEIDSDKESSKKMILPCGGFRHPVFHDNDAYIAMQNGQIGNGLELQIDTEAFEKYFLVQEPVLFKTLLQDSRFSIEDIKKIFFQLPFKSNAHFILDCINLNKETVKYEQTEMVDNISASAIPRIICKEMQESFSSEKEYCLLMSCGSGFSLAGLIMEIGCMDFCEVIETII